MPVFNSNLPINAYDLVRVKEILKYICPQISRHIKQYNEYNACVDISIIGKELDRWVVGSEEKDLAQRISSVTEAKVVSFSIKMEKDYLLIVLPKKEVELFAETNTIHGIAQIEEDKPNAEIEM